jgi:ABC-2 type transport system ATP-binding protein
MWDVIDELARQGVTVLLTTQYLEEADQLAKRVVVIDRGNVIAEGTPDELKAQVGGEMLELHPLDDGKLELALAAVRELGPAELEVAGDGTGRHVALTVGRDTSLIAAAVRRLDDAGVELVDLRLRRPTLDDVFLALTGHAAAGADEEAEA